MGWDWESRKELPRPALSFAWCCPVWGDSLEQSAVLACLGVCRVAVTPVPPPVIIWEGMYPCLGGMCVSLSPSLGCRAMPHSAWRTASPLLAGAEWGGWLCSNFQRFPRDWTAMLWGNRGWHVPARKLLGQQQHGHGGPRTRERLHSSWGCVSHLDPLLKASMSQHSTAGVTQDGSQGLSLLSSSWAGGTDK